MTSDLTKNRQDKSAWETLADTAFFTWIILTFFNERSSMGRISLLFFVCSVALYIFFKAADIRKTHQYPSASNLFFISYIAFYLYNYWRIEWNGILLHYGIASEMLHTIFLNGIFIYFVYKYCVLKNKMDTVLNIYVLANVIIMSIVVVGSGKELMSGRLGGAMEINANSIALVMITCLVVIMHKNVKEKKVINTFLMLICMGSILLTGSRKGLIGMVLSLVLYQGMSRGLKKYKNLFVVAVVIVISYFLIMNVEPLYDIAGHRVEALLSYFKGESIDEASLISRDDYTQLGWKYVAKRLWIGYGLDCFRVLKGAYGTYSHNNYLELMFGCGLIGTILYYLGYLYILFGHLKLYYKHKFIDSKPYIILMVIQMFLEYAYVSYFSRQNILFVVISLGALQLFKSKIQDEEKYNEEVKTINEAS